MFLSPSRKLIDECINEVEKILSKIIAPKPIKQKEKQTVTDYFKVDRLFFECCDKTQSRLRQHKLFWTNLHSDLFLISKLILQEFNEL